MSNRLIGNGSGLSSSQGSGMGEGWSDFVAMLTTVRPEDAMAPANANWNGAYPVGAWATWSIGSKTWYEGIRRYPYSADLAKNPLTFQHVQEGVPLPATPTPAFGADGSGSSEVHSTGEVWQSMLWDCYVGLLRDTARYTFPQANLRMRQYLVASLKLTPNAPTILEARMPCSPPPSPPTRRTSSCSGRRSPGAALDSARWVRSATAPAMSG